MATATQPTPETLRAALAYAGIGWRVFPVAGIAAGVCTCQHGAACARPGKHPLIAAWQERATIDEAQIRAWWSHWPEANIGIPTGRGLLAVDVDPRSGGRDSLAQLEAQHGPLPATLTVSTGGGGEHYFFAVADGPAPTAVRIAPGIDLRGDGGYVVAPPSRHASGGAYTWRHAVQTAPAPTWLTADRPARRVPERGPGGGGASGHDDDLTVRRVRAALAKLPPSIQGQNGSGALYNAARIVAGNGLDEHTELDLLADWDAAHSIPAWGEAECARVLASVARGAREQVGLRDRERKPPVAAPPKDLRATLPTVATPAPQGIRTMRLADVKPERVRWLWFPRLPLGKITMLQGNPGEGKTTLAMDIAARLTRGDAMPGCERTDLPPSAAILINVEDGAADTLRPRASAAGADLSMIHLPQDNPERPPLRLPDDVPRIEASIVEHGARLLVIDGIMGLMSGDANSDQDVRAALGPLKGVAERTGCAVVIIRHLNKARGASAMARGSGSVGGWTGLARAVLMVGVDPSDKDVRVLAAVKSNLGPVPASLGFRLAPAGEDSVRTEWCGESEHTADDLVAEPRRGRPPAQMDATAQWLREALARGPALARELFDEGAANHSFSARTVKRAKTALGVTAQRIGHAWWWRLPDEGGQ